MLATVKNAGDEMSTIQTSARERITELVRRIRDQHVRTVFTETSLNPSLERQIASEAGVRVEANLYGDSLGPPGSPGTRPLRQRGAD